MFNQKSQSAIEFIILVGAVLFFFTIFFVGVHESMSDKIQERQNNLVKELAFSIQDEINLAYESGEGYRREFKIPEQINGQDYEANLTAEMIYIKTSNGKHAIALPVLPITGNIIKGTNIIKKQDGILYLNL